VRRAIPGGRQRIDPATRTFQALRIQVNDELGELRRGLRAAEQLLREGGRLAVISFHSLEDRPVKHFLRQRSRTSAMRSRHLPPPANTLPPTFKVIGRRPLRPTAEEVAGNPRARSARLRVAERTSAPAWQNGVVA
jgi:16S rRNA (cytosine1402-N4)-methyltransferase